MTNNSTSPVSVVNIYTTFAFAFLVKPEHEDTEDYFNFEVPTGLDLTAYVSFKYASNEGHIRLFNVPIDDGALQWLEKPEHGILCFSYPPEFEPTFARICQELTAAVRKIAEYVKYFLGRDEIADELAYEIQTFGWSRTSTTEYKLLPNRVFGRLSDRNQLPLTVETAKELAFALKEKIAPFDAMRHLYRAIQEKNARFKWIDATIAAELAVKEALIRKQPLLAAFIEHVPSPPLRKLYGELLETYLGEKSPHRNALENGATKRNKLVHQPNATQVTIYEAEDYVNVVMQAIHHLYALLYPEWSLARDLQTLRRFYC